jgi:hypothetical protein
VTLFDITIRIRADNLDEAMDSARDIMTPDLDPLDVVWVRVDPVAEDDPRNLYTRRGEMLP